MTYSIYACARKSLCDAYVARHGMGRVVLHNGIWNVVIEQ